MISIILCILSTSALYVVFRLYEKYRVPVVTAIVVNYLTAFTLGVSLDYSSINLQGFIWRPWMMMAMLLGIMFFIMFNLISQSSNKVGMSITGLFNKLSLIIPICIGIFFYNDQIELKGYFAIALGGVSLFLVAKKLSISSTIDRKLILLLSFQFIGPGIIDSLIKYSQEFLLVPTEFSNFSALSFLTAFMVGAIYLILNPQKFSINFKAIIGGIILGLVNYGTIYFMLKSLDHVTESSKVFMIINFGIIICTSIIGVSVFKEKLSKLQYIGIALALALVACYLIY